MGFLVNSSGITVEIDDDEQCKYRLRKGGFRVATEREIEEYKLRTGQFVSKEVVESSVYLYPNVPNSDGYGMSTPSIVEALRKEGVSLIPTFRSQKIGMVYSYPHALELLQSDIKVLYSMFESTKIPEGWVHYLIIIESFPMRRLQLLGEAGISPLRIPAILSLFL